MPYQSPKLEMVDSRFKKVSDTEDEGIMKWVPFMVLNIVISIRYRRQRNFNF
ncbi:hypothetical protein Hdeb2414_s0499g00905981 [Helianthus debilis subsp. tardiflorus]